MARGLQLGIEAALCDALDGVLRNHGQRQRFGQRQLHGVLLKVDEARGLHAFDVAAVGRGVQIGLEHLAFAVAGLQPEGRKNLREFSGVAAAVDAVDAPRQLHGERGAALSASAAGHLPTAAEQRDRVDSRVPVEAAVFVEQHGIDQRGRDVIEGDPDAVLLIRREREAQQLPVARIDRTRRTELLAERGMRNQAQDGDRQREQYGQRDQHDQRLSPSHTQGARGRKTSERVDHLGTTCRRPPAERENTRRSYMSSP